MTEIEGPVTSPFLLGNNHVPSDQADDVGMLVRSSKSIESKFATVGSLWFDKNYTLLPNRMIL